MAIITGDTQLLGVLGCPVEHSLSPAMHNAALCSRAAALGHLSLAYVYLPLRVEPKDLGSALAGMAALGWRGFNVTIPHKQAVMPLLQQISPLALAVGAVNTVWRQEGAWFGTNTDVQGFLAPLLNQKDWSTVQVCILGAGGAARAVIAACVQLGCQCIHVVGRDELKLNDLHQSAAVASPISLKIHSWQALDRLLPSIGLLVNTTPVGMHSQSDRSPLCQDMIALLPTQAIVYDLIYTPRPTHLLKLALQHGCKVIDGLEMLICQGAAAFEIWVGESPDLEAMRAAAITHLEH
jgi:shikimate dehydrogenase